MITSRQNAAIKAVRALRQRQVRTETGLLFADGTQIVGEAIQSGMAIEQLIYHPDRVRSPFAKELVQTAQQRRIPCLEVSDDVYDSLTDSEGRQGLGAVIHQRWTELGTVDPSDGRPWVAMNAVQYPGNLGTVMRTLESVGGAGLILLGHSTDPYDPGTVRASLGSVFSLKLIRTDLPAFAAWKRRHGVNLVAADLGGTVSYRDASYHPPTVLLMGAERDGITAEQRALCDTLVRIPMAGRRDSLNVAIATGLILYEIFHQTPALRRAE